MKKALIYLFLLSTIAGFSQIGNYNFFPTLQPQHILDEKLTDISFAYSMRVLESDYEGKLVELRRASDNKIEPFGWGSNDIVDVAAINSWRGTSLVYIVTWYDQSKSGRNAVQTDPAKQPQFFPDAIMPYFKGDGVNDHLTVTEGEIKFVTNNGVEGTVIATMMATNKSNFSFGVKVNDNRWSSHVNWSNNKLYFDPGSCCNESSRSFANDKNEGSWDTYSFIRANSTSTIRSSFEKQTNPFSGQCTLDERFPFAIGFATGALANEYATTSFNEFIMYKTDIVLSQVEEIEGNAKTFWGIIKP
jgi:hypothetical protein